MTKKLIAIVDDSRALSEALPVSALGEFRHLTEPAHGFVDPVQQKLLAGHRREHGESILLLENRQVAAIGINVSLSAAPSRPDRSRFLGLTLFEWIRLDQRMTVPVVLWSFFSEEILRGTGVPALRLSKGHLVVHLPAPLTEFHKAFEAVVREDARLSSDELERMLVDLYGPQVARQNPLLQMDPDLQKYVSDTVASLDAVFSTVRDAVSVACDSLRTGSGDAFAACLRQAEWQTFRVQGRELDRRLRTHPCRIPKIEHMNTAAVALQSFGDWWTRRENNNSDLERAAHFYQNRLLTIENMLNQLKGWVQHGTGKVE